MSILRFRTKLACRIAGIDRDRFNEAVAAGNYGCAPKTDRGATRVFSESDLIALFYYGRLLDSGFAPSVAGVMACSVSEKLSEFPDEEEILIVLSMPSGREVWAGCQVRETPRRATGSYVLHRVSVDVGNIRKVVRDAAEEEARILGEDDE